MQAPNVDQSTEHPLGIARTLGYNQVDLWRSKLMLYEDLRVVVDRSSETKW